MHVRFCFKSFLKNLPALSKDVLKGFRDGIKLGRAYLKSLGHADFPIRKLDEKAHVDMEAYQHKPAYRKGTRMGVDSTLLTKDLGSYIKEGYTYDTGPTAEEVTAHDSLKQPPPKKKKDVPPVQ